MVTGASYDGVETAVISPGPGPKTASASHAGVAARSSNAPPAILIPRSRLSLLNFTISIVSPSAETFTNPERASALRARRTDPSSPM